MKCMAVADAPPRFPSERSIRRADLNGSGHHGVLGGRAAMAFLGVLALEERDVHFGAVDAHQLAATVSESGRRQQQEEFLEVQSLDGTFYRERGVGVGNSIEHAITPPGSVDSHD